MLSVVPFFQTHSWFILVKSVIDFMVAAQLRLWFLMKLIFPTQVLIYFTFLVEVKHGIASTLFWVDSWQFFFSKRPTISIWKDRVHSWQGSRIIMLSSMSKCLLISFPFCQRCCQGRFLVVNVIPLAWRWIHCKIEKCRWMDRGSLQVQDICTCFPSLLFW